MRKDIFKFISVVLVITFLYQNIAWSVPVDSPQLPNEIYIPEQYGQIEQANRQTGQLANRTVVLIKDAHCHYEAQKNIAKIIEILVRDYFY